MRKLFTILFFIVFASTVFGQIPLSSNFGLNSGIPLDNRLVKADTVERNAILAVSRYEGMTVYVIAKDRYYQLIGGITNDDWMLGGGSNNVLFGLDTIVLYNYYILND